MKILTVKYQKKFPYAKYLNEDIGFEVSVDKGEEPLEVLGKLKELATEFFYSSNPHLAPPENPEISAVPRRKLPIANIAHEGEQEFIPNDSKCPEIEDGVLIIQDSADRNNLKKIKPDMIIIKKLELAIKTNDQKTIDELYENYDLKK